MSKMGEVILEIQELAHMGMPNDLIAERTGTSIDVVNDIVKQLFEDYAEYYAEPSEYDEWMDFDPDC